MAPQQSTPMMNAEAGRVLRQRIFAALMVLVVIFGLGTTGYYLLGQVYLSQPGWALGDCAYMTLITITTVGFGELPNLDRVPGGRLFTATVLLMGLGVALYFVSTLTSYFIEGEFTRARVRRKMTRAISHLKDHIIVCGAGTTGIHVVEELAATRWPVVAVDLDERHLERLQALTPDFIPVVHGDATEDEVLEQAGIRRARGVVAALTHDKDNLFVVVTARELNPSLKIIAKGVELKAAEKLRKAGADSVVNPAFIGGVRMVSEMIRPQVVEFLDLMLRDRDKNLRIEEVEVPASSPLVGKLLLEAQIRQHTNLLVLAVREPQGAGATSAGRFVYNPGPETTMVSGMTLVVLGETEGVQRLRAGVKRGFQ